MEMGKLIRQARKNAGLMQAELAERVGISINSVRLYESCRLTPKVETLRKVAEDANEDGCVLSINMNRGDRSTTAWPWNVVAAFPDCLPVWMPLPKKPDLKNLEGAQNE